MPEVNKKSESNQTSKSLDLIDQFTDSECHFSWGMLFEAGVLMAKLSREKQSSTSQNLFGNILWRISEIWRTYHDNQRNGIYEIGCNAIWPDAAEEW